MLARPPFSDRGRIAKVLAFASIPVENPRFHAKSPNLLLLNAVIAYSLAVQFVWLNFGQFTFAWIPYQNYLWTPSSDLEGYHRT